MMLILHRRLRSSARRPGDVIHSSPAIGGGGASWLEPTLQGRGGSTNVQPQIFPLTSWKPNWSVPNSGSASKSSEAGLDERREVRVLDDVRAHRGGEWVLERAFQEETVPEDLQLGS